MAGAARRTISSSRGPGAADLRRIVPAAAGPLLIAVAVVVARRGFLAGGLTDQHPDVLSFWLPRFCYLGRQVASGHLPLWNPLLQAGTPYLAEPQSGWLHLSAMLLFSTASCGAALRWLIVLHPLLAGLGTYAFLRVERLHRVAATVGGLSAAMILGGSSVGASLPFSGSLAWTPILLAAASGFSRTDRGAARLGWAGVGALAWSQVAAAHLSNGLAIATALAVAVLAANGIRAVRDGRRSTGRATLLAAGFLAFLPLASLAMLLPRLALTPDTSLKDGYAALADLAGGPGRGDRPLAAGGVWAGWPLALAGAPGAYAGSAVLLAIPAAFRRASTRALAVAVAGVAFLSWVLTLDLLVGWTWFRDLVVGLPLGDFYLHNPGRLRNTAYAAAPILGAIGVHTLLERPPGVRRAAGWVAGGAAAFLALPLALGAFPVRLAAMAAGSLVAGPLLVIAASRARSWARPAVAGALAVELAVVVVAGQLYSGGTIFFGLEDPVPWIEQEGQLVAGPLRSPDVDPGSYAAEGPIVQAMTGEPGRYLTWAPPNAYTAKGYLFTQQEENWPGLAMGRGMLFGLQDAMGYNPIQLERYWRYVRGANDLPIFYNASVLQLPHQRDLRLLGIRWLTVPRGIEPPVPARAVVDEERWTLWEVRGWQPRASVVAAREVAPDASAALQAVLRPGFDPARVVVLERSSGLDGIVDDGPTDPIDGPPPPGSAAYREVSPEDVRVRVSAPLASVLVVRNAYDPRWSATIDGEPAEVVPADFFLQGVAVPAGEHEVRLVYGDPWIGRGLLASGFVWLAWATALVTTLVRDRARRRRGSPAGDRTPVTSATGPAG
jgi:hypothetical protein